MRIIFGAAALLAAVSLATGAPAREARKRVYEPQPTTGYSAGPVCQKLCESDMTPCDSPEFKRADGRCNASFGNSVTTF